MPKTDDRARVGPEQADDHAQRRGLAGAVRPEQRVELAGADREIEMIDRRAVERLGEPAQLKGGAAWLVGPWETTRRSGPESSVGLPYMAQVEGG